MSKELKYMYKTIAILLSLLLVFGILSCNLDGSGIFLTISESTEIEDSNLATEPVREILYKDGDNMYILHGTSVKSADIVIDNPIWTQYAFKDVLTEKLTPISEAVFVPGTPNKLVYSSAHYDDGLHSDDGFKSVYVSSFTTPSSPPNSSHVVTGLGNVKVIDIIIDGSVVYAIIYNQVSDDIEIYTIDTTSYTSTLVGSFSSLVLPTSVHFISNGVADTDKYFIFVCSNDAQGCINSYLKLSDLGIPYSPTELFDSVFETSSISDDDAKNSPIVGAFAAPIVGAFADGTTIYLVTYEGILITSNDNFISFTKVNAEDPMSNVLNAYNSIPITIAKTDTTDLLLIGGLSNIYYSDISTDAAKPVEFSSTDTFYSNLSSTQVIDFYNVPGDFSFYTATSNKWIWKTTDEASASTQLL